MKLEQTPLATTFLCRSTYTNVGYAWNNLGLEIHGRHASPYAVSQVSVKFTADLAWPEIASGFGAKHWVSTTSTSLVTDPTTACILRGSLETRLKMHNFDDINEF